MFSFLLLLLACYCNPIGSCDVVYLNPGSERVNVSLKGQLTHLAAPAGWVRHWVMTIWKGSTDEKEAAGRMGKNTSVPCLV